MVTGFSGYRLGFSLEYRTGFWIMTLDLIFTDTIYSCVLQLKDKAYWLTCNNFDGCSSDIGSGYWTLKPLKKTYYYFDHLIDESKIYVKTIMA